jgi:hypothetical protein
VRWSDGARTVHPFEPAAPGRIEASVEACGKWVSGRVRDPWPALLDQGFRAGGEQE